MSKGENYIDKSIQKAEEAKKAGAEVSDQVRNLTHSLGKKIGILMSLLEKGPKNLKKDFAASNLKMKVFEKRVNSLLPNQ